MKFKLIHLLIIAVLLTVVFSMARCFGGRLVEHAFGDAPDAARQWARKLGMGEVAGVECATVDSDDDGYVSCTVSTRLPDGTVKPYAVECAAAFSLGHDGCRMQRLGPR